MEEEKPRPDEDETARDADLARREKALTEALDELEDEVKSKKPTPPPIGAMF
jgi:hypothetical protein